MSYKEIAEHVAAILADPDTPAELYNSISETVLGLADAHRVNIFHPDVLPVALPLAFALARADESDVMTEKGGDV